jgi:hypothetical protein
VGEGDREASQTRDYCVAKGATHRAARLDPSLRKGRLFRMTIEGDREASQTRDYCVAKGATHRAARPDPSLRKGRLFRMTIEGDREASQTRDYCVAKARRIARLAQILHCAKDACSG